MVLFHQLYVQLFLGVCRAFMPIAETPFTETRIIMIQDYQNWNVLVVQSVAIQALKVIVDNKSMVG
jgi:hypothetical protein